MNEQCAYIPLLASAVTAGAGAAAVLPKLNPPPEAPPEAEAPPTPMETDNATTLEFIKSNIRQKKSTSWDMRCNWLRDRNQQKQFRFYWNKGEGNLADYFTKHHAPKIHRKKRSIYYV